MFFCLNGFEPDPSFKLTMSDIRHFIICNKQTTINNYQPSHSSTDEFNAKTILFYFYFIQ